MTDDPNLNEAAEFYRDSMQLLQRERVPFLVGGAFAMALYTGIARNTKDFDLFVKAADVDLTLETFQRHGYRTEKTHPHWLAKALRGEDLIDIIYRGGNGLCEVDDSWFARAPTQEVLGISAKICAPEEIIWMKSYIMERERYDGADVAHVIKSVGDKLDWRRLIDRYGPNWRVLYAHLVLYGFIYPAERSQTPQWVMEELAARLALETKQHDGSEKICYGSILSRQQYLTDIGPWGYKDARLTPLGNLSKDDIAHWTAGIERDGDK
jgi:hypothetical protein